MNWRTSSLVKLARFRRPKAAGSFSYVEYGLNENAAILLNWSH
jgi:amino acid transporter